MSNRLSGISSLAYQGTNAAMPPNMFVHSRAPTSNDTKNVAVGDFWVYRVSQTSNSSQLWVLLGLAGGVANWVLLSQSTGTAVELTGNSGGAVPPDSSGNINVVGDGTTITIAGTPGTNTLTASLIGGDMAIDTIIPDAGINVVPDASGNVSILGGTNITTTGTLNTLTIDLDGTVADTYTADSGTATPSANNINIVGTHGINTAGATDTVTVAIDNAITLGDLSVVTSGNDALTITSGDITLSGTGASAAANITIPVTNSGGTQGVIYSGAQTFIHNYNGMTFVGRSAGVTSGTANACVGIGQNTLQNITGIAAHNVAIGTNAMKDATTARANMCVGQSSGQSIIDGNGNMFIGYTAGQLVTTGDENCAIGDGTLNQLVTGSHNIAIGKTAGTNLTGAESSNIYLNNTGIGAESNILRIGVATGSSSQFLAKAFVHGIRGITTDVNDAVPVLIDSAGQLGTTSSSARYKENIEDMGSASDNLMKMRPVTFDYKKYPNGNREYGFIAEEVAEIMPDLVVYHEGKPETVKYHVMSALLLNEIQKLSKRVEELESKQKEN